MRDPTSPSRLDLEGHKTSHTIYAELQRGESVVEKQVKEARTKCRSIASLLTDAPNPNSKGVLMFKKRRQRAKKYTLTCFGKAEGDGAETEGETGGETEEEGGSSFFSGSDVEEEGFSASFDPTWDSGYLDVLDRRSSACPSTTPTTPTTPTANHITGLDTSAFQSPGLLNSSYQSPELEFSAYRSPELDRSNCQASRLESSGEEQPINSFPAPRALPMSPPAVSLTNGGSVGVSRATVVLSPPSQTALPAQSEQHASPMNPNLSSSSLVSPDLNSSQNPANVLNRTARPFTPGPATSRLSVTPVTFRPPQPRPAPVTPAPKPVAAVSMVTIAPPRQSAVPEARRAVSSTSLYIPPRNTNPSVLSPPSILSPPPINGPPSMLSPPPPPVASATFSHPPVNMPQFSPQPSAPHTPLTSPPVMMSPSSAPPFSPPAAQGAPVYSSPAQPFSPPPMQERSAHPPHPPSYSATSPAMSAPPMSSPQHPVHTQVYAQAPPPPPPPPCSAHTQPPPTPSFNPYMMASNPVTSTYPNGTATAVPPSGPAPEPMASREQRISVPAARTGILQEARRRANKKPMFASVQNRKDVSPNPALLSALQNIDVPGTGSGVPGGPGAGAEAGHESGPEEDWLRLGAEACNFMQAQKGPRPPPVAPKPQAPQIQVQLGGRGGELFARRQSRMDRYTVERSPSVAAAPYSPAQTREPSPTPSLPAAWKYSSNIRAPPPISYNPLLSPSCPLKAQKAPKAEVARSGPGGSKGGKKGGMKPLEIMTHQPYQLNSSLFGYGGSTPAKNPSTYQQHGGVSNGTRGPAKTGRVYEVKRFSTPPPTNTGPSLKVIAPRSATTLGEPLCRPDVTFHHHIPPPPAFQTYEPPAQWATGPLSPPPPPAPTGPLPYLPNLSNGAVPYKPPPPMPTFTHLPASNAAQANKQFKSAPDLSPVSPNGASQSGSSSNQFCRVPRPRFSTSNLGLQPGVWRPGSTMH